MKIAIISALQKELDNYLTHIDHLEAHEAYGIAYWQGTYQTHDIIIAKCGVGKVNAAMTATLLGTMQPDLVINNGTAGAVDPDLKVGDVVIAMHTQYHDVDATAFGNALGQVDGMPERYPNATTYQESLKNAILDEVPEATVVTGTILSGDSFIADPEKVKAMRENFEDAECVEMESTAIGQVCYRMQLPFLCVRVISDTASQDADVLFDQFVAETGKVGASVIRKFLTVLQ
ncbi:MAG: 5'-methylthioadenosine/adenosylhomocysteine nucleosidase [Aerococcus sp.]|nr:5'-methylthioadenosine/adenosylhomocysteine nucleosidase [Aerococcus sp.]